MKKILILGGSRYILPIIEAIHKLGYYAITCDYLPDNIAHKYSDEYHNVSIIEKDKVLELARNLQIDGIMSFACDPGVETAAYVAEKMGLPTNPYESVRILQNKILFRNFLTENGFNVPKAMGFTGAGEAMAKLKEFRLPVIVKPSDSAGSKGVTRIDSAEEKKFCDAFEYARSYSKTHSVIVEEFIQQQGCSSDTDCFSIDGELKFVSFANQMFDRNAENPYTPAAYTWPSGMPREAQQELRGELQRLVTLLGLRTSIYNVETRLGTDGKTYIMEVSPRGGGNRLSEMLRYASQSDLVTDAVKAAAGDPITDIEGDPVYNGHWAEVILHSEASGIYQGLEIDPEIADNVIEKDIWVREGDSIHSFTGANETVGTLVLKFETAEEMDRYMSQIDRYVHIRVRA